ncbi:hypothetical protein BKA58DRAFT_448956 [Alternaria rosae]|uniref:uncharacterized protein n=1 Tax=Alternaria rosae TaxID=1187941 RepID=UPI001E8ED1A2|nr:uncharacterized protein BKA58DRAFT_448956 [Alternaria rosae]KAH6861148.1 hypothetical protein BKA58DRAFT_448956 [Alternaria rosae]
MDVSGTTDAAFAVLYEGELVLSKYLRPLDRGKQLPVDEEIIFQCAVLTKAIFSAAMAICVEEGLFNWNTPVQAIMPSFHTQDEKLHQQTTIVDRFLYRADMQSTIY